MVETEEKIKEKPKHDPRANIKKAQAVRGQFSYENVGRKTKMDKDCLKKLEEAFAIGASDAEACMYAEISKQTLWSFEKKNPKFRERIEELKEKPILKARQEVVKGLPNNPDFALKFLERKRKKEFSLQQNVDLTSGGKPFSVITTVYAKPNKDKQGAEPKELPQVSGEA